MLLLVFVYMNAKACVSQVWIPSPWNMVLQQSESTNEVLSYLYKDAIEPIWCKTYGMPIVIQYPISVEMLQRLSNFAKMFYFPRNNYDTPCLLFKRTVGMNTDEGYWKSMDDSISYVDGLTRLSYNEVLALSKDLNTFVNQQITDTSSSWYHYRFEYLTKHFLLNELLRIQHQFQVNERHIHEINQIKQPFASCHNKTRNILSRYGGTIVVYSTSVIEIAKKRRFHLQQEYIVRYSAIRRHHQHILNEFNAIMKNSHHYKQNLFHVITS